jgi:hypothetical protein
VLLDEIDLRENRSDPFCCSFVVFRGAKADAYCLAAPKARRSQRRRRFSLAAEGWAKVKRPLQDFYFGAA